MRRMLGLLLIALHAPLASAVYRCVDEQGHTLFGDTPPGGCGNVPIYEVSPSGMVLRRIDPTPTPQQLEMQREQRERHEREARAAAEQRRKDMALLNTYDSAAEFDMARDRNIQPVAGRITAAQERIKELDQRERDIEKQVAGFAQRAGKDGKKAEAPAWMVEDLQRVRSERKELKGAIVRYNQEIGELRARYDGDKKRWIALKAAGGSLTPDPAPQVEPVKAPPAHRRLGS
ncbi:MAG TPA: DUF4124 domain-containing protein [Usitatibacter sp.]|nr:DUF4124 domain-containing protein [Usitatibacter sp.]